MKRISITNPTTGKNRTVRTTFDDMSTVEVIAAYAALIVGRHSGDHARKDALIDAAVDELSTRADNDDAAALAWYDQ